MTCRELYQLLCATESGQRKQENIEIGNKFRERKKNDLLLLFEYIALHNI